MNKMPAKAHGYLAVYLFVYIFFLLLAHWITVSLTLGDQTNASNYWAAWFDLDREYNVPTWTNAALLAISGLISIHLALISKVKIQRIGWTLFGLFFSYLSLDEALIIHEQLAEPTRKLLNITHSHPLYHAWVIPALFIVIGLALMVWIITRYHKQLIVFSDVLKKIVLLAGCVVALEIMGTFIYGNTAAYRYLMVPTEEIFELSMAALILLHLRTNLIKAKQHAS